MNHKDIEFVYIFILIILYLLKYIDMLNKFCFDVQIRFYIIGTLYGR